MIVNIGTTLKDKNYGTGICTKVDNTSKDFKYFFRFVGKRKKDITLIWLSQAQVDNMEMV